MFRIRKHWIRGVAAALLPALLVLAACATSPQPTADADARDRVARISPQEAYPRVAAGKALLVCAYEREATCARMMLEGAITLKAFEGRLAGLGKDQPVIFYCA